MRKKGNVSVSSIDSFKILSTSAYQIQSSYFSLLLALHPFLSLGLFKLVSIVSHFETVLVPLGIGAGWFGVIRSITINFTP